MQYRGCVWNLYRTKCPNLSSRGRYLQSLSHCRSFVVVFYHEVRKSFQFFAAHILTHPFIFSMGDTEDNYSRWYSIKPTTEESSSTQQTGHLTDMSEFKSFTLYRRIEHKTVGFLLISLWDCTRQLSFW